MAARCNLRWPRCIKPYPDTYFTDQLNHNMIAKAL